MSKSPRTIMRVIRLADQVRVYLAWGKLSGRTVLPDGDGSAEFSAEEAARIVLDAVEQALAETRERERPPSLERWRQLAAQLRTIERAALAPHGL